MAVTKDDEYIKLSPHKNKSHYAPKARAGSPYTRTACLSGSLQAKGN